MWKPDTDSLSRDEVHQYRDEVSVTSSRRCRCSGGRPTPNQNQKNGPGGHCRPRGQGHGVAVVRGRHASWGSRARRSGHGPLQAELTRPGPCTRTPGSGTRLLLFQQSFPCDSVVPTSHTLGRPHSSGWPLSTAGSAIVCQFYLLDNQVPTGRVLAAAPPTLLRFGFSPILTNCVALGKSTTLFRPMLWHLCNLCEWAGLKHSGFLRLPPNRENVFKER